MSQYSNVSAVPLSLAVFLATDHYDHNSDPFTISATTLIKPVRQIVLSARVPESMGVIDLTQMVASRMGTAIHDGIERAWKDNYKAAMAAIGIPQKVIDRIRINPTPPEVTEGVIPVYLEQRAQKKVGKWTVTGKYDFIGEGRLEDFKSTSVYTAINNTKHKDYAWQGSMYRWLNPELITKPEMAIQYLFTDWSKAKAMSDPKYPQQRIQQLILPLKSISETDAFVRRKLALIEKYWDAPEDEIPYCTDEELWRSEPVFKYYKNGDTSAARSTKNFDDRTEAYTHLAKAGCGAIKEVPGQVTACRYCPAFAVCSQKDQLVACGDLVL